MFHEGDIVRLKSGGPKMTVHIIRSIDDRVVCRWFDGNKVKEHAFVPEVLKQLPKLGYITGDE